MYETYPSKKHCKRYGKASISGPSGGTAYPGKSLPGTQDDTGSSHIKQAGNGAGSVGGAYPKGRCGCDGFPNLNGLPS